MARLEWFPLSAQVFEATTTKTASNLAVKVRYDTFLCFHAELEFTALGWAAPYLEFLKAGVPIVYV